MEKVGSVPAYEEQEEKGTRDISRLREMHGLDR